MSDRVDRFYGMDGNRLPDEDSPVTVMQLSAPLEIQPGVAGSWEVVGDAPRGYRVRIGVFTEEEATMVLTALQRGDDEVAIDTMLRTLHGVVPG